MDQWPAKIEVVLPAERPAARRISVHPGVWALAGVSLAGFSLFAGFGGHSLSLESCAPACTDGEVRRIVTERAVADAGLALGAAALVGSAISFGVTFRREQRPTVAAGVFADHDGVGIRIIGRTHW
jgi:hypothetical protein